MLYLYSKLEEREILYKDVAYKGWSFLMETDKFIQVSKHLVKEFTREEKPHYQDIEDDDVYVVWSAKVLQNNKALLGIDRPCGLYFEITYNGDKNEIYFDAYNKMKNIKYEL